MNRILGSALLALSLIALPAHAGGTGLLKAGSVFQQAKVAAGLERVTGLVGSLQGAQGVTSAGLYTSITGNRLYLQDPNVQELLTAARAGQLDLTHSSFDAYPQLRPLMQFLASEHAIDVDAFRATAALFTKAGAGTDAERVAMLCAGNLNHPALTVLNTELAAAVGKANAAPFLPQPVKPVTTTAQLGPSVAESKVRAVAGRVRIPRTVNGAFASPKVYANEVARVADELRGIATELRAWADANLLVAPRQNRGWWVERDESGLRRIGYLWNGEPDGLQVTYHESGAVESVQIQWQGSHKASLFRFYEDGRPERINIDRRGTYFGKAIDIRWHENGVPSDIEYLTADWLRNTSYTDDGQIVRSRSRQ